MLIEFTQDQLMIVDQALRLLPWGVANPLFVDINRQISEQQNPQTITDK